MATVAARHEARRVTRWLFALGVAVLAIAAGWIAFLNPARVPLHVTPARTVTAPLSLLVVAAFVGGGTLVALAAAVRAGARGWRGWRTRRRAARDAERAASTARARELLWTGDYVQARAELTRGDRSAPDAARLALLAETHLGEADVGAARAVLEHGLAQVGLDPHLLDLLAETALRTGDARGAIDALERARTRHPESPRLARRLRDAYAAAGRWPDALGMQNVLLVRLHDPAALADEQAIARALRYQVALGESDPRRSGQLLAAVAREDPTFAPAWASAGDRWLAAGRRLTARRLWERGARHRPVPMLLDRLAQLYAERADRVTRLLRRLVRRHPDVVLLRLRLVRHLLAQGELDAAAAELEALPGGDTGLPEAQALWGDLHRRRGNHTLAAESLARAVDLAAGDALRCSACGAESGTWVPYCTACNRWRTFVGS